MVSPSNSDLSTTPFPLTPELNLGTTDSSNDLDDKKPNYFMAIPPEMLLHILQLADSPQAPLVCKGWNTLLTSNPQVESVTKAIHKNGEAYVKSRVEYFRLDSQKEALAQKALDLCEDLIEEKISSTKEIREAQKKRFEGNSTPLNNLNFRFNEKFKAILCALKTLNTNEIDLKTALKEPNWLDRHFTAITDPVDLSLELIHYLFLAAIEFDQLKLCQLLLEKFDYDPSIGGQAAIKRARELNKTDIVKELLLDTRVDPEAKRE